MEHRADNSGSVLERARQRLRQADPERVAALAGAQLARRESEPAIVVRLLDQVIEVAHPSLQVTCPGGKPCPQWQAHLLTYYLSMADGTRPAGVWVALRDLPDGTFYQSAYQGYSGGALMRAFGNDLEAFRAACRALGAETLNTGDAGYRFLVLPRLWLAAIYWLGEEDIPPSARVLFDAAAKYYLPTDACAALGGWLANRIIEQNRNRG